MTHEGRTNFAPAARTMARRTTGAVAPRLVATAGTVAVVLGAIVTAEAAPALRKVQDQKGDFVLFGNTLGQDCSAMVAAPTVGTVGACGTLTTDSAPDIFWQSADTAAGGAAASTAIAPAMARSTAMLVLPAGVTGADVTYARLYWSAALAMGSQPDTTATIERPGTFSMPVTAAAGEASSATDTTGTPIQTYYQSSVDVTALVQVHGVGPYRVSGVDSRDIRDFDSQRGFAGWWMVVFYKNATDPQRNLALFDGIDMVEDNSPQSSISVMLQGFLVPQAGFDAKLGVVAFEGDDRLVGDAIRVGTTMANLVTISNSLNPADNFFNSTRSSFNPAMSATGVPVSNMGDLPQLTGGPRSLSSIDLDVVDVKAGLSQGATSAVIQASTVGDFFILAGFVTSISTLKPDLTQTTKTFANVTVPPHPGGAIRPGDTIEFTVTTRNTGNDAAVGVVLKDVLAAGVSFVPGSSPGGGVRVTAGANVGGKTDMAGDDQAEYNAATRTITVRLGTGADATAGGTLAIGDTTTITFRVTIDANARGPITNQAVITAAGMAGAPAVDYPSDGNGPMPGTPPTSVPVDECLMDGDCPMPKPFCIIGRPTNPNVCGECRTSTDCTVPAKPVCDATTHACRACAMDSECPAALPLCQTASGRCVGCRSNADCGGFTPLCNAATGTCGPCTGDGAAGGCSDPRFPACQLRGTAAGACTECSDAVSGSGNVSLCGPARPECLKTFWFCGCSDSDGDSECGSMFSGVICNAPVGACVPGCSEAPMRNRCPMPQTCSVQGGGVGVCQVPMCTNDMDCSAPRPKCDTMVMPRQCVQCLADGDCKAPLAVCNVAGGKVCVQCTATKTAACSAAGDGARCLMNSTCGCQADGDCGGPTSGRVCDTAVSKCTFGCRGTGGNGCPAALLCSSSTMAIGQCLTPGAADAGAPDVAPDLGPDAPPDASADLAADRAPDAPAADLASDAAPDAGTDRAPDAAVAVDMAAPPLPSDAAAPAPPDNGFVAGGGCKCDLGATPPGGSPVLWPLAAALALALRRRRR